VYRVRADPRKVWKVLEFNVEIFNTLKSLENDHRYGKVWKILENVLAVHDTKHLKLRVQKFESHSVFGIEEYTV